MRRFERARLRHPDRADLHNLLGISYRNLGQYEPGDLDRPPVGQAKR